MNTIVKRRIGENIMAAVAKRRMAGKRRRGFTLVEVIVVLVILAILAAIAIPALTGYIEKAQWTDMKQMVKRQMTAVQTMMHEQIAAIGTLTPDGVELVEQNPSTGHDINIYNYGDNNVFFRSVAIDWDNLAGVYLSKALTTKGLKEYQTLTAEEGKLQNINEIWTVVRFFEAYTDVSGTIKVFKYADDKYFDEPSVSLHVLYVADSESSDPLTRAIIDHMETDFYPTSNCNITDGYNIAKIDWSSVPMIYTKLN